MRDRNKYVKFSFLLPIGIIMLLPPFILSFVQIGNVIDKTFFFIALLGYGLIITSTILCNKKSKNRK